MSRRCCTMPGCRRVRPVLVRRGPLSGKWIAITRWHHNDQSLITATEKHVVDPQSQYDIELGSSVLLALEDYAKTRANAAHGPAATAYRDVLNHLDQLRTAKRDELLGDAGETGAVA